MLTQNHTDGRRAAAAGVRSFLDSRGAMWTVREVRAIHAADAPRAASLVFETECIARRVSDYPSNWRALSDAELEAVSWRC